MPLVCRCRVPYTPAPVTLKQGEGHQTGLKQGDNIIKFEKPHLKLNSVHGRTNDNISVKSGIPQLSPLNLYHESKKQWYIHDQLNILNNPTSFNLIR